MDLALIQTPDKSCVCILVLLGERKNKERFLAAHQVRYSGRNYEIGDEKSVFDKSNILGKGMYIFLLMICFLIASILLGILNIGLLFFLLVRL